jgi:hypothetical protein
MAIETTGVTDSNTTVHTASGNEAITFASFTNVTGSAATLTVFVVPNGDSPSSAYDGNATILDYSISSKDTHQLYLGGEKLLLENGDSLVAVSDTATSFTAVVSYTSI